MLWCLCDFIVVFLHLCRYVAVTYETGDIDFMQMQNHNVDISIKEHHDFITGLDFTNDSEKMCTCSMDRTLCIFALQVSMRSMFFVNSRD